MANALNVAIVILLTVLIAMVYQVWRQLITRKYCFKKKYTFKNQNQTTIMLELQNDQFVEVQSQLTDDDGQAVAMTDFSVVSNDPSVASVGDVTQLENGTMEYDVIGTIGNVGATVIVETATTPDGQVVTNEYAVSTLPNPVGFTRTFGEPQNQ